MRLIRLFLRPLLVLSLLVPAAISPLGGGPEIVRAVGQYADCNYTIVAKPPTYTAGVLGGTPSLTFLSQAEGDGGCTGGGGTWIPQPYCSHGQWGSTFRVPRKDKDDGTPVMAAPDTILSDQWGDRVVDLMWGRVWSSLTGGADARVNPYSVYWASSIPEMTAETLGLRYVSVGTKKYAWKLVIHQGDSAKKLWEHITVKAPGVQSGVIRKEIISWKGSIQERYPLFGSNGSDNQTWLFGPSVEGQLGMRASNAKAALKNTDYLTRIYGGTGLTESDISSLIGSKLDAAAGGLDALYDILAPTSDHYFSSQASNNLVLNPQHVMNMANASWLWGADPIRRIPIAIYAKQPVDKLLNASGLPGVDGTQDTRWEYDPVTGVPLYDTGEEVWDSTGKLIATAAAAAKLKDGSVWNAQVSWPSRPATGTDSINVKFNSLKSISGGLDIIKEGMHAVLGLQRNQRFIGSSASFVVLDGKGGFGDSNLQDPLSHPAFGPKFRSKFYAPAMRRPYTAAHGSFTSSERVTANSLCGGKKSDQIDLGITTNSGAIIPIQPYGVSSGNRAGVGNDDCDMNSVSGAGADIAGIGSCYFAWLPYQIKPPKLEWQSWITTQIRSYLPQKSGKYVSASETGLETTPAVVGQPFAISYYPIQPMSAFNHINAQLDSVNFAGAAKLNFSQVGMTVEIGDPEGGTGFILPVRLEGKDGNGDWTPMVSRNLSLGKNDFSSYKVSLVFPRTPAAQAQITACRDLKPADLLAKCGVGYDAKSNQLYYHVRFRTWWESAFEVVLGDPTKDTDARWVFGGFSNIQTPKTWTSAQTTAWRGAMRPWDCTNWTRYTDPSVMGSTSCNGQRTIPRMFQSLAQPDLDYLGRSSWTSVSPYYDKGERWSLYGNVGQVIGSGGLVKSDVDGWGTWDRSYSNGLWAPRPLFDPSVFECWDPATDPTGSLAKAWGLKNPSVDTTCWMDIPVLQAQGTP